MKAFEDREYIQRYSISDIESTIYSTLSPVDRGRFTEYRKAWQLAEKGIMIPEKPLYVVLEVSDICNLECVMCYRAKSHLKYEKKYMSMDLLDKILSEVKELSVPSLLIGTNAECLIHPQIELIIEKVKSAGVIDFIVITNGIKLTKDISNLLVDLSVERLNVSLDAATPETFKKIRGGNLVAIEENIMNFLETRNRKNSKTPILRVSFVKMEENKHEKEMFYNKWKDHADIIDFQDYIEFDYVDHLVDVEVENFICAHPFTRLAISWRGDIFPCCTFFQKHFKMAHVNEMTLAEAWDSSLITDLRSSFLDEKLTKVCKNCYGSRSQDELLLVDAIDATESV